MEQQNVHQRPDGSMGKQNRGATDMGSAPNILHRQMAGMQSILRDNGETIAIQGGRAACQETAAAVEEGELQAMLFALLQEQHDKQIAAMAATNKANMETMMEKMNALVAGRGGDRRTPAQQPDKENTPPPGGNVCPPVNQDPLRKPRRKKAICPNCKTFALHKPENCYELEANKDKRWPGWKSVHATA